MAALAMYGMMITVALMLALFVILVAGPVGNDRTGFVCCTVSAKMQFDKFCCVALLLTIQ
jgi:hypothetical protein